MASVTLQPLFLILLAFSLLLDAGDTTLCVLSAVFVHEGGHLLMMGLCRVRVRRISFEGFRIEISSDLSDTPVIVQAFVATGGVLANLVLMLLLIPFVSEHLFLTHCCYAQGLIAAANLVPLEGLDGGDVYRFLIFFASRGILQRILKILRVILLTAAVGISLWMVISFHNPAFALFLLATVITQRKERNRFDGGAP